MKTHIETKPIWSTEKTKIIEESIWVLNKIKEFAWKCGLQHVSWQTVKTKISNRIKKKGHWLEIAMAFLFGYMNLPIRLSFSRKDDLEGADLVFKKTGISKALKIQLKWNNHLDHKYSDDIVVVHVDTGMKAADIVNQFQLWKLLGTDWHKRITRDH